MKEQTYQVWGSKRGGNAYASPEVGNVGTTVQEGCHPLLYTYLNKCPEGQSNHMPHSGKIMIFGFDLLKQGESKTAAGHAREFPPHPAQPGGKVTRLALDGPGRVSSPKYIIK